MELITYPGPREAFAAALRGEVNLILMPSHGQLELLNGVSSLRIIRGNGVHSAVALFNSRRLDASKRLAIARALPIDEIATAYGPTCSPRAQRERSPTEPLPTGLEILAIDAMQGFGSASLALRRALAQGGTRITLVTPAEAYRRGVAGDFDVLLIPIQSWPTESALSRWRTGHEDNWGGYSNPAFDNAFLTSDFDHAQAALDADPPAVFICDIERTAAVDARLKNATLGDYDILGNLPDWEVSPP